MISAKAARAKLKKVSNFSEVLRRFRSRFGKKATLMVSRDGKHKYEAFFPNLGIKRKFGDIHYEDFTKHKDKKRRRNFRTRASHNKGSHWKKDRYSPNRLAIDLLW